MGEHAELEWRRQLDRRPSCQQHSMAQPCPLCRRGAWPLRDLEAVADFAGRPYEVGGLPPEMRRIRLSEVVRSVGRRWSELERVKMTVLQPLYDTKTELMKEVRIGAIDVTRLERAARLVARGLSADADPVVDAYVRAILDETSPW